ncbi:hypothetical protein LVJ94_16920 [Pendulispora rubella]|uniref:Carboxypeptidase regulatory-like domain-containing protein n=1 Tax=Pendulispora rubella TaxID=2741070 RepID=A0ABZ2LIB9_9BACT
MTKRARLALYALLLSATGCRGCSEEKGTAAEADASDGAVPVIAMGPNEPANAMPVPSASVHAVVNPKNFPVYDGPTGSVEGTLTVTGDPAAAVQGVDFSRCPEAEAVYGKAFREGPPRADGSRPLADALVVITGYSGYIVAERRAKKAITIEHCAYSTRTLDLTFGQVLQVYNRDPKMHAPQIADNALPALMVASPGGDPVEVYPGKPGFSVLVDKMSGPWMAADVYTFPQPLHAVTDREGHFRIDGVPSESADHHPMDALEIEVFHRSVSNGVKKPLPAVTGNTVARMDLQVENHARPDAGTAGPDASTTSPDSGKKPSSDKSPVH